MITLGPIPENMLPAAARSEIYKSASLRPSPIMLPAAARSETCPSNEREARRTMTGQKLPFIKHVVFVCGHRLFFISFIFMDFLQSL